MRLSKELSYIQQRLVLAAHPGLSLEEAKYKEIQEGCILWNIKGKLDLQGRKIHAMAYRDDDESTGIKELTTTYMTGNGRVTRPFVTTDFDINDGVFGLPPTLSRVLNYDDDWFYRSGFIYCYDSNMTNQRDKICKWKLLNDDGSDATLFDQSDETITAIAREMGYKSK